MIPEADVLARISVSGAAHWEGYRPSNRSLYVDGLNIFYSLSVILSIRLIDFFLIAHCLRYSRCPSLRRLGTKA